MNLNPELQRNLWLEFSAFRLIQAPVVLGMIFLLTYVSNDGDPEALVVVGSWIFYLLVLFWGCRLAAAGIAREVRVGTWDWQRMSAVGPWAMAWGKLIGGTSFVWYAAGITLVPVVYGWLEQRSGSRAAYEVSIMVLAGLLGQVVALAMALSWLRKGRPTRQIPVTLCQLLGIAVAGVAFATDWLRSLIGDHSWQAIAWYDLQVDRNTFILASVAAFLLWALFSIYRLMQAELQVRIRPWGWLVFTIFVMAYASGLYLGNCRACGGGLFDWLAAPYVVAVAGAYLALFLERKDIVGCRNLLAALAGRAWDRVAILAPFWLPAAVLFLASGLAIVVVVLADPAGVGIVPGLYLLPGGDVIVAGVLAQFWFFLRDLCLVLALNFAARRGRADAAAVIQLAVLYVLVPWLLGLVAPAWTIALFSPFNTGWPWLSLTAGVLQAGLALGFLILRWRKVQARFETGTGRVAE